MASSQAGQVATAAATALIAGLGLNSYFGISKDITQIRFNKQFNKLLTAHIQRAGPQATCLYRLLELADPHADAVFFEGRSWTYAAMKREVAAIALGLRSQGVKNNDVVGVFMTNSPEMLFTIHALSKLGAIPALMNSNLRDDTLLHCVQVADSNMVISTPDIATHAANAASRVKSGSDQVRVFSLNLGSFTAGGDTGSAEMFPYPSGPIIDDITTPPKTMADRAAFIFTSGTTGKPKACSVKNALMMVTSCPSPWDQPGEYGVRDSRYPPMRVFSCMPMFHGTTFFTGVNQAVGSSGCFCISRKFSARNYWQEVTAARADRILYVGELCRFLLATPEGEYDRKHNVKVASGNGLQRDVWVAFQKRFGVEEIREFYRSTEGLVKYDNRHFQRQGYTGAGRVGYRGTLLRKREVKEQAILRFDYDSEEPVRDPQTGFCIVADRDEPGEAVAKIASMATYTDYHNNAEATEKKLLRNVFEKGDVWQRSGDLLVVQNDGWVRFVDRIGDTFRWKGENVSAGEIRAFISDFDEVQDAVVVGKVLKGYDGQAGVAALSLLCTTREEEALFMDGLYPRLKAKGVPHYAFPRLVAITDEVKVGDTFKHAKQIVKALLWSDVSDGKKYWLDVKGERYVPLNEMSWADIDGGRAKL
ncbi:Very long-chain acyl-CoA synthetase [Cyphellophora attinorum]|uniref:Very long-chain acyl-CoA synthetase n=1 Tax=Cyphellophora attinorum TaxID=1664694 RepID=A0A0N1HGH6_9EURO|nr:Very long-chain acyl-CoA synthetase [Phialophora attinorum]KPI44704.1 Very long-chain acyl-CoA synthetase [Phialophora attinorum]